LIDAQLAAFMTRGVSIIAASRGPGNAPTIARAAGCRLSADRGRVTVLVAKSQAGALLDAVQATGSIGVVFSQPSTHRTIQLKGADAKVEPAAADDAVIVARYADAFAAEVCPLGYTEQMMRALVWAPDGDFVAVTFSPSAAFDQTPGPRAGSPLRS
jgi:hypothetical protein